MSLVDQFLQDNEYFEDGHDASTKELTESEIQQNNDKTLQNKKRKEMIKFYGDSDSDSEEQEENQNDEQNEEENEEEEEKQQEQESDSDQENEEDDQSEENEEQHHETEQEKDEDDEQEEEEESEQASEIKQKAYQRKQQHKYSFSSSSESEEQVAEVSIDESKISHHEDEGNTSRKSNRNQTEENEEEEEQQDEDEEEEASQNNEQNDEDDDNQEENGDEEIDFYQLSDMENSQFVQDSNQKSHKSIHENNENISPQKQELKSSIAKVASLLDSHVTNYDKVFSQSVSVKENNQEINSKKSIYDLNSKKPDTEMTFGDLSSSECNYDDKRQNKTGYSQSTSKYDRTKPLHKSTIYEEDGEDGSGSLMYSQISQYQPHQSFNNSQFFKPNAPVPEKQNPNNYRQSLLKSLMNRKNRIQSQKAFIQWKDFNVKEFYNIKLKNAAQMVDKMSRFSRNFISLNSLNSILQKNKQRQIAKAMIKWSRATGQASTQDQHKQSSSNSQQVEELNYLRSQLEEKVREISKMELMFKEYSNWRSKLEQIELKMKSEVDYWKQSCDKLQNENSELQKEALKVTQALMERTKLLEAKESTIDSLQKKLKATKAALDPVEEAFCPNCKNSLEESQVFGKDTFNQQDMQLIRELNDKLMDLEKQVMTYRERVSYHESVEDELKNNIESQVDVVLKMEEERLLLLKDNRDIKDKNNKLVFDNEDLKEKINIFEKELEELQAQFKQQQLAQSQQKQHQQSTDESSSTTAYDQDSQWTQSTMSNKTGVAASNNKENKNLINKKKPLATKINKNTTTGVKKQSSQLKFQTNSNTSAMKTPFNDQASTIVGALRLTTIGDDNSGKSKAGQEPVNKMLVSDNQVLTNELIVMNREISKLKAELRISQEQLKKSEKEKYDAKKNLEGKDTAVEKLRREKDELWAIVNTDKYKNIKTIEQEKEKSEKYKIDLQTSIEQLKQQVAGNDQQQQILKDKVAELEYSNQKFKEKEFSRDKLLETLELKSQKYEKEYDQSQSQLLASKRELEQCKTENAQHKKDLEWLANSAKKNKMSADRAIADLEAYTQILRGMEKKLAGVEIEKEAMEGELQELKQKYMMQMSSHIQNQSSFQQQQQMTQQQKMNSQYQNQQQNNQYMQTQQQHTQQQQPQWSNQQLNQIQQQNGFQQQQQRQQFQHPGQQLPQNMSAQRMTSGGAPQPQKPPQRFV